MRFLTLPPLFSPDLGDGDYVSPVEENGKRGSLRKQRKGRTRLMFTRSQTRDLERHYAVDKYPKIRARRLIAQRMNIKERRVQVSTKTLRNKNVTQRQHGPR